MCFWNIGGLKSRTNDTLNDPIFLKQIENFDLIFLAETHLGPESSAPNLGSYNFHTVCREKSKHNNRHFGGLGILVRKCLHNFVTILPNTCRDYQWIKLDKIFFNLNRDLYICLIYIPPTVSPYIQKLNYDILDCLEQDILKYKDLGNIILTGDLNARTGSESDLIVDDNSDFLPIFEDYPIDNQVTGRSSKDNVVDSRGRDVIDLCISNQLRILNGRVFGDIFGSFTCFTPNGSSTVDYVIASEEILNDILYFRVSEFIPTLSDTHCKLSWAISARYKIVKNSDWVNTHSLLPNFHWGDDSPEKCLNALNTSDIQSQVCKFY